MNRKNAPRTSVSTRKLRSGFVALLHWANVWCPRGSTDLNRICGSLRFSSSLHPFNASLSSPAETTNKPVNYFVEGIAFHKVKLSVSPCSLGGTSVDQCATLRTATGYGLHAAVQTGHSLSTLLKYTTKAKRHNAQPTNHLFAFWGYALVCTLSDAVIFPLRN